MPVSETEKKKQRLEAQGIAAGDHQSSEQRMRRKLDDHPGVGMYYHRTGRAYRMYAGFIRGLRRPDSSQHGMHVAYFDTRRETRQAGHVWVLNFPMTSAGSKSTSASTMIVRPS